MRPRAALFGLLAAVLVAGAAWVVLSEGSAPYTVKVEFANADGLQADFAVRVQGVVVGRIAGVTVTPRDTALATLELDPSVAPIGAGASASINPSNLLGEKYVLLERGDLGRPQPSGTTIPLSRSSTAPELDQVIDSFNPPTRLATGIFLAEQGDALVGRGHDLANLLERLPGSLDSARQLIAGLDQDNAALGRLIDESNQILLTAAPQRAALGRLVTGADGALAAFASRDQQLGATIENAPGAVAQLRHTLSALQATASPLGRAATGLRATADPLARTLQATPKFARAAQNALTDLGQAGPALRRLGRKGSPVVRALEPGASRLVTFSRVLAPVSTLLGQRIGSILDVLQGWARAIGDRDGIGHVYRVEALLPQNIFTSLLDMGGSGPLPAAKSPLSRVRAPAAPGHRTPAPRPSPGSLIAPGRPSTPGVIGVPGRIPIPAPSAPPAAPAGSSLNHLLNYLLGK